MGVHQKSNGIYKEWMLVFDWYPAKGEVFHERFFFDTKEQMMHFVETSDDIRVEAMFHVEQI